MSYYGKKAQPRSANNNKSTVAELRKGKYIADRKHRNKYLDDYIRDDYLKEDYSRMYYELLATYMRGKLNEEIAKAEQHVEELRALANRNHRE